LIFEQLFNGAEKVLSWDNILGLIASIQDFTMWRAGARHIV